MSEPAPDSAFSLETWPPARMLPRTMPCLLVQNRRLVKTVRFRAPAYVGDPVNAIKIYNEKEVDELILLDIAASREKRPPPWELLAEVVDECFMPLCYGGGVSGLADMERLFKLGIEKVALNSAAFGNPGLVREAARCFGCQSVVIAIEAKRRFFGGYAACWHNASRSGKETPAEAARRMADAGAGEILLNAVDRDGTWAGYDLPLLQTVTAAVEVPVVALGGAATAADFARAVREGGASACAAGSMAVYQGKDLGVLINFPTREQVKKAFSPSPDCRY